MFDCKKKKIILNKYNNNIFEILIYPKMQEELSSSSDIEPETELYKFTFTPKS